MTDDRYNNLKKKYDELLEETEYLKAKIRTLESQQNSALKIGLFISKEDFPKER
jgi:hypothetical protein